MKYGTWLKKDDDRAEVITKPKKNPRTYRYPFVRVSDAWMLARERAWYTEHALTFAAGGLDGPLVRKQIHPEQTTLDDFDDERPSEGGVGAMSRIASAD